MQLGKGVQLIHDKIGSISLFMSSGNFAQFVHRNVSSAANLSSSHVIWSTLLLFYITGCMSRHSMISHSVLWQTSAMCISIQYAVTNTQNKKDDEDKSGLQ
jgi:hypothetical protein